MLLLLFSHSVVSTPLRPQGLQQTRLPCPSPSSLLKLMSIESMMPSSHLILCCPLCLLLSVFPSIRVFSNELAPHVVAQPLHSFCSYFSALLSSILGTYQPGGSSFSVISFCLFILLMGFSI